jgi:transposase
LNNRFPGATFYTAYEAGFCGTNAHLSLTHAGLKNIIINPADLPETDKHKRNKTDVHDSRAIARYLEAGLLKGIYIMPREQQELRSLFRFRQAKVKDVTRANNRLKSFLNYFGIQFPAHIGDRDYLSRKQFDWLRSITTRTPYGRESLNRYIDELIYQRKQLYNTTKKLKAEVIAKFDKGYYSAITLPGYGPITAIALLSEIGDLSRFDDPDEYCSYLGLAPSERSSGETSFHVRIQPRCNKHLRPILIEAAWISIRKCPVLLQYYKKHAGKEPKKAIIKVAAKLALIAKAVILNKSTYMAGK